MSDDDFPIDPAEQHFLPPPKWPIPVGIISIALGGLGLVCGGLGLAVTPFLGGMMSSQLQGAPLPPNMQFGPVDYTLAGVGVVLSVLLLIAGIMLIGRHPVSRWLHLIYAVTSIPLSIMNLMHQSAKQAAMAQWAADYPDNPIAQAINSGAPGQDIGPMIGMCFAGVFGIGFPLFLFVWFMLIKTRPEHITGTQSGVF
jgi:hypothetical protein